MHQWDQIGRRVVPGVAENDGEMLPELGMYRAPGRDRTCDPLLRRQPLYPLSYRRSEHIVPDPGYAAVTIRYPLGRTPKPAESADR